MKLNGLNKQFFLQVAVYLFMLALAKTYCKFITEIRTYILLTGKDKRALKC